MDCIPPWLSSKKQCYANITIFNHTKEEISQLIQNTFEVPKRDMRITELEATLLSKRDFRITKFITLLYNMSFNIPN